MNPKSEELSQVLSLVKPYLLKAFWFSLVASLLLLAPTAFMLETYDRVVNSRNHFTLLMLVIAVLCAFVVMEVLEWSRQKIMHAAGLELDEKLADRIFAAMFTANLR